MCSRHFEWSKISIYQKIISKSHGFVGVMLNEKCRWPRKLLFETELYESLEKPGVFQIAKSEAMNNFST